MVTMRVAQRAGRMLQMYLAGKTLVQIGRKEGITRERVRQIITQFPAYKEKLAGGYNREYPAMIYKVKCLYCGKKFRASYIRKFCDMAHRKSFTEKRWQEMKRKKCSICGKVKSISSFYPLYNYGYAKSTKDSRCKECHVELCEKWRRENLEAWRKINNRAERKYRSKLRSLVQKEPMNQLEIPPSPVLSEFGRVALLRFHRTYGKIPTMRKEMLEFLKWEKGMGKERKML